MKLWAKSNDICSIFHFIMLYKWLLKNCPKVKVSNTHNEIHLIIGHSKWTKHKCPEQWVWSVEPQGTTPPLIDALQYGPGLQFAGNNKMRQKWCWRFRAWSFRGPGSFYLCTLGSSQPSHRCGYCAGDKSHMKKSRGKEEALKLHREKEAKIFQPTAS